MKCVDLHSDRIGHQILVLARALLPLIAVGGHCISALGSTLEDAAAAAVPGSWVVLNQQGDGSGYGYELLKACGAGGGDCGDNILNYADKGLWSPSAREIHFLGKGAGGREFKFISYSESSNTWVREAKPYWDQSPSGTTYGHGYEHSAVDPARGDVYWRNYNSTDVFKWARATKSWFQLSAAPNPAVAAAIEYFPDRAGLLLVGGGSVHFYTATGNSWTRAAQGLAMGGYHNVAVYNPVRKLVVFGGGNGSRSLYAMNASGEIRPLPVAPVDVAVNSSILTVDPASGQLLLFGSNGSFHEFDFARGSWRTLESANVPIFNGSSNQVEYRVAVPISTHGVIAILTFDGRAGNRVYLYRHSPSPPTGIDRTPPLPPTNVRVD